MAQCIDVWGEKQEYDEAVWYLVIWMSRSWNDLWGTPLVRNGTAVLRNTESDCAKQHGIDISDAVVIRFVSSCVISGIRVSFFRAGGRILIKLFTWQRPLRMARVARQSFFIKRVCVLSIKFKTWKNDSVFTWAVPSDTKKSKTLKPTSKSTRHSL